MNDTTPEVEAMYRKLVMAKSPQERLLMACSMHETARQMAEAAIRAEAPGVGEEEIAWRLFLRFYGHELSQAVQDGFRAGLRAKMRANE